MDERIRVVIMSGWHNNFIVTDSATMKNMLAHLGRTLRHLFLPHHSNNHRPKLLCPHSLATLAIIVGFTNVALQPLSGVVGGVLGYASDITIDQVLEQTNKRREEAGLTPLTVNTQLSDAARRKASDMFTFDYWAHTNPTNGTEPWYFFDAVGYKYHYAGENLARDFATTTPMVQAWIDSPTHRDNMLSPKYQETGIAVVNGTLKGVETTLVVQLFGTKATVAMVPQVAAAGSNATTVNGKATVKANVDTTPVLVQSEQPTISPLAVSKSIALSTFILVALVILVDSFLIWRRKTQRMVGHNWAHLLFISTLIVVVLLLQQGVIK